MPCPYRDCRGQITPGQTFCTTCGRSLDPASVAASARFVSTDLPQPPPPTQPYQAAPYPIPPNQYQPPQTFTQNDWYPQRGYPQDVMPVQPQPGRSGSKAPVIILLVALLVVAGLVAGYFVLNGIQKSPVSYRTPGLPFQSQTFNLVLPVFDRDNNFVSDAIRGSNGVSRRLSMAALPYSTAEHGQTSGMTSMEIALQKGDKADFSNDSTIMSINFVTAQGLADSLKSEMRSRYPGADYQIVVPTKGQSYQINDNLGWKLKITVDDLVLDSKATMSDASPSPYPLFTTLKLTAVVTPN